MFKASNELLNWWLFTHTRAHTRAHEYSYTNARMHARTYTHAISFIIHT